MPSKKEILPKHAHPRVINHHNLDRLEEKGKITHSSRDIFSAEVMKYVVTSIFNRRNGFVVFYEC